MNIFVTADLHLGHTNIIKHCGRYFNNVNEMDETIINNWNSVIKQKDLVYIVGDFAWKTPDRYISKLNGKKILIRGNHDYKFKKYYYLFQEVHDILIRNINEQKVVFCHYKLTTWPGSNRGAYHLHGHSHGMLYEDPNIPCCDIGVDVWNFIPVSWETIVLKLKERKRERIYCNNKEKNFQENIKIMNKRENK